MNTRLRDGLSHPAAHGVLLLSLLGMKYWRIKNDS